MADVRFYGTTSDKLGSIEIKAGNIIFCEDERCVYLDSVDAITSVPKRTAYRQIMLLATDDLRQTLIATLVSGFYFVLSTNILWRLDGTTWYQITERPSEQLVYGTLGSFPRPGKLGVIYYTDDRMYHWDPDTQSYQDYCTASPEWIIEH